MIKIVEGFENSEQICKMIKDVAGELGINTYGTCILTAVL